MSKTCGDCRYHFLYSAPNRTRCLITVYDDKVSKREVIKQLRINQGFSMEATIEGYSIPRVGEKDDCCVSFEPKGRRK